MRVTARLCQKFSIQRRRRKEEEEEEEQEIYSDLGGAATVVLRYG
jgi:hypothetical protein